MTSKPTWNKDKRPATPQRGVYAAGSGVTKVSRGRKGSSAAVSGKSVRYCRAEAGARSKCEAFTKAKDTPATAQDSNVSSSMFERSKTTGAFTPGALKAMCKGAKPGVCRAQVGYRNGRRVLRFCVAEGKPGRVVDITGKSPGEVRDMAQKACADFRKGGYKKPISEAGLGGLRRGRAPKRKTNRKSARKRDSKGRFR